MKDSEGQDAVRLARSVILASLNGESLPETNLQPVFEEKRGVFVTLLKHPSGDLRGCIGFSEPIFSLEKAIKEQANSAAFSDPRFPEINEKEFSNCTVEVTVLTTPEKINCSQEKFCDNIEIGRHGLIIEKHGLRGLFLPQVPVEQNWDKIEYLDYLCLKAGLRPGDWKKDAELWRFEGEIFSEETPNGEIERRSQHA